jgi:hypothetical protein
MIKLVNRFDHTHETQIVQDLEYQERVARTVERASRRLLGKNACLTQALTSQLILKRHGIPARLRIGVQKNEQGFMQAHAWVENDGLVVIGGRAVDLKNYTPLPDVEENGL